ncbi:TRAP transporter substrate-binding protein DctP [Chloroflexota bacterium]
MMKSRFVFLLAAVLLLIGYSVGCAEPAAPATEEPEEEEGESVAPAEDELPTFTIKQTSGFSKEGGWVKWIEDPWGDYVVSCTDGRVTREMYYDGSLVAFPDTIEAIEEGIADMGFVWVPSVSGRFPLMKLFSLPGLMKNQATSDMVMNELWDKYPQFSQQFDDLNVINNWQMVNMRADLHCVKPIRNLDDLKGKVIATHDDQSAKALNKLGASAQVMNMQDYYMSAKQGVIDAIFCAWGTYNTNNLGEVTPYHLMLGLSPGTSFWFINKDTWSKFTDYEQRLIMDYRYQGMFMGSRCNVWQLLEITEPIPEENFFSLPIEDQATVAELYKPSWEEWAAEMEGLGYPGDAILADTIKYLRGYTLG